MSVLDTNRYTLRPATEGDVAGAVRLFNAYSQHVLGLKTHDAEQLRVEWRTPGFCLATDTVVVAERSGELVGYAEVWDAEKPHVRAYSWARVHPEHRDEGIDVALLDWVETRADETVAKAPADARVALSQAVPTEDLEAAELLTRRAFMPIRHFWRMQIELDRPVPNPAWPDGISVRAFDPDADLEATVRADRDAFRDHWGHVDQPFEDDLRRWKHWIDEDKDLDFDLWFLAMDGDEIAGMALCEPRHAEDPKKGHIGVLGVRRPWRRRGLGLALLHHAFRVLADRGYERVDLGVDAASLTGATRLYERAGMSKTLQTDAYEKELRPGVELVRRSLNPDEEHGDVQGRDGA